MLRDSFSTSSSLEILIATDRSTGRHSLKFIVTGDPSLLSRSLTEEESWLDFHARSERAKRVTGFAELKEGREDLVSRLTATVRRSENDGKRGGGGKERLIRPASQPAIPSQVPGGE